MDPFVDTCPATAVDRNTLQEAGSVIEDAARGLSASTDPLAVYARRMHAVRLLTRDEEINLAKGIEAGRREFLQALASCPTAIEALLACADESANEESVDLAGGRPGKVDSHEIAGIRKALVAMRHAQRVNDADSRRYRSARAKLSAALAAGEWHARAIKRVPVTHCAA